MNANLERLRERFEADPGDALAFEALEEHHFVRGEWSALVRLYGRRLEAADLAPERGAAARARLLLRLGQVLEERCHDEDGAAARYQEAARLDPRLRPAFQALRRLYVGQEKWDLALQVAELEAELPMPPAERAAFLAEMGRIWIDQLGDTEQARAQFDRALEADPRHPEALRGAADLHQREGRAAEAAALLERALAGAEGPDRARIHVRLARLLDGPLAEPARAGEHYRRALTDDPRSLPALEALAERARVDGRWDLFEELSERRFNLTSGAVRRLAIAHDVGHAHLERQAEAPARHWFQRAVELFPDDPVVHLALADVERLAGDQEAVAAHLRRATELADDAAPVDLLVESARLAGEDSDLRVSQLRRAHERRPDDPQLLEELARSLSEAGRDEELAEVLEQRAALAPQGAPRAAALLELGRACEERLGDEGAALDAFRRAAEEDRSAPEVAGPLARLLRKREDWEGLRDHLERAVAASAGSPERAVAHQCALGELLIERWDDLDGARTWFERAVALDAGATRARQGLERIALALGDDEAILDAFEREAAVTSDRARLSFLVWELARIFEERQEPERALAWILRLVEAVPEDRRALEAAARLQEALGRREALCATLEALDVLLDGDERAAVRRRRARTLAALGRHDEAARAWRRALESAPEDPEALRGLEAALADGEAWAELAEVRERLLARVEGDEARALRGALAALRLERLDDPLGAIPLLEALCDDGDVGAEEQLEEALRRTGRLEALAGRLEARAARFAGADARHLALRRVALLLDELDRPEDAASALAALRRGDPRDPETEALRERALRRAGDAAGLEALLAARSEAACDPAVRERLGVERAELLESLEREDEARALWTAVADAGGPAAARAEARLERLLERAGDAAALRARIERRLADASGDEAVALHERAARLARDHQGDRDGAIAHLEAAAARAPDRPALWRALAQLYRECERPGDWLRVVEAELATGPDDERTRLLHARAAELARRTQDEDRAAQHYEALLALDPSHAEAVEFLATRYEARGEVDALAAVLTRRLASLPEADRAAGADTALCLRIAALHADAGRPDDAIALLEEAAERPDALLLVAEPLADLYQQAGRRDALVALAGRARDAAEAPEERAGWALRLGDALRAVGDYGAAAEAYRRVRVDRPDDPDAEAALRDLYRRLGEADALVRLQEAHLARVGGEEEIPLRLELAGLLDGALGRPAPALAHLRRVLELAPDHAEALARALDVAERAEDPEALAALLDHALPRRRDAAGRAQLLARRAGLDAEPAAAAARLREALALAPGDARIRRALRRQLEATGDHAGVLAVREAELAALPPDDVGARAELCEEAASLAAARLGGDAALPWLLHLRRLRPGDPDPVRRIAALHREAGRAAALLRSLEEERDLSPEPARLAAIERERARLFEAQGAPGRALAALEAARRHAPDDDRVLADLARLHRQAGRTRSLAQVLDARAERAPDPDARRALLREAAAARRTLGEPARAADRLYEALRVGRPTTAERSALLRELGDAFADAARPDLWARTAEAELAGLDPADPVFAERRRELHFELACAWQGELGQPDRAVAHLRTLLDEGLATPEGEARALFERAESALLHLLRARRDPVELERRLTARLARQRDVARPEDAAGWLELAHLRAEALHRPAAAAEAFEEVLARDPRDLRALRGLRAAASRLGRMEEVATALERELALRDDAEPGERAALYRRLGEVCWRRLDSTTRASRAFAAALEADPRDLVSLRALESLLESMEDWRGALDLYESEISVLGDAEPARRQQVWLHVGTLARDRLDDAARALRAFEAAAGVAALPLPRQREWAELHAAAGDTARFAEVFGAWCDAAGDAVCADDEVRLATVLEEAGRREEARERLRRATRLEPGRAALHDALARLEEALGDPAQAAASLERAAAHLAGAEAAARRIRAASLLDRDDPDLAARHLEQACDDHPAGAEAPARLAALAGRLGRPAQAEEAADRALAAAESGAPLAAPLRERAALAGAEAARHLGHLETAARLFTRVLEVAPEHPDALAARGEVLYALGDRAAARADLERRLALATEDPARAAHRAMVGDVLAEEGRVDEALEQLGAALREDPAQETAHRARAALLEREGRIGEAVDALQAWAARAGDDAERAARLLRAAELELGRPGREEPAEALLREAVSVCPSCGEARVRLAELLQASGRPDEARHSAEDALEHVRGRLRARAQAVRGRAFELREERSAAADAWQAAAEADPAFPDAAFAAARLRRGLGDWTVAAELLRGFVEAAPPEAPERAAALHQLGRLRAGPLEDVDGAIQAYREALDADPDFHDAREALAELLVHRPGDWDEALARHRELLERDPTRLGSLRAVLRIARGRGSEMGTAGGLALLRALGAADAQERAEAPARAPFPTGTRHGLADPDLEAARRVAGAAADELAEALDFGRGGLPAADPAAEPLSRFRAAAVEAEGELSAPALVPLDAEAAGRAVVLTVQLALEAESVEGDGDLVNALARSLGRRARRRVRRALGERSAETLAGLDWHAWRAALRGAAGAAALARTEVDLRTALLAWLPEETAVSTPTEADLRAAVSASAEARALLATLVADWLAVV